MKVEFSAENQKRFEKIVAKYEQRASALLPTLWLAQEQFGYLSNETILYVSTLLDMPPVKVHEAVTFYVMYRRKDMGKYCLQICQNISCTLMGAEHILKVIQEETGLSLHGVSENKQFSLVPVQCLGSCDTAPVVQINDDYFEKLDPEIMRTVIRKLKNNEYPAELAKSQGVAE